MSLERFISHVRSAGMPTSSRYELILPANVGGDSNTSSIISMLCNSLNMPGVNIMTTEIRKYGELTEMPHGINYSQLTLTFYTDNRLTAKSYFDVWSNQVYDRLTRSIGYYNDFTRDIEIKFLDKEGNTIDHIKLFECYPKTVQDIHLDSAANTVPILTVQMVYKWWESLMTGRTSETINQNQFADPVLSGPEFGFDGTFQNIRPETLANITGVTQNGLGFPANFDLISAGSNLPHSLINIGSSISTNGLRQGNAAAALFGSSNIYTIPGFAGPLDPGNPYLNIQLSDVSSTLGNNMANFGSTFRSLSESLQDITAPAFAISNSVGAMAGTVGSIDGVLRSIGVDSGLGKISGRMAQSAGYIQQATNLGGLAGSLDSVGANLAATGAALDQSLGTLRNVPNYTNQVGDAMRRLSGIVSQNGNSIGQASTAMREYR